MTNINSKLDEHVLGMASVEGISRLQHLSGIQYIDQIEEADMGNNKTSAKSSTGDNDGAYQGTPAANKGAKDRHPNSEGNSKLTGDTKGYMKEEEELTDEEGETIEEATKRLMFLSGIKHLAEAEEADESEEEIDESLLGEMPGDDEAMAMDALPDADMDPDMGMDAGMPGDSMDAGMPGDLGAEPIEDPMADPIGEPMGGADMAVDPGMDDMGGAPVDVEFAPEPDIAPDMTDMGALPAPGMTDPMMDPMGGDIRGDMEAALTDMLAKAPDLKISDYKDIVHRAEEVVSQIRAMGSQFLKEGRRVPTHIGKKTIREMATKQTGFKKALFTAYSKPTLKESDQQEVTFYNSGFGQKPSEGKKKTVHGSLKMGERGPLFVTQDGTQAIWDANLGWLADMD